MKILLASAPLTLLAALAPFAVTATVEAEYGAVTVRGTALTFAHHGANAGQPCPCSYPNTVAHGWAIDAVGISHADLDTLGGVLAIQGRKPEAPSFWALAEFMDLNGAHKLALSGASESDKARLYAWWAWSEQHRLFAPRDGSVVAANAWIDQAWGAITRIVAGDATMLAKGADFAAKEAALNKASLRRRIGKVLFREHAGFTNHLYADPGGDPAEAVVAYNPETGGITLSFAEARPQDNACKELQRKFGALAGGHKGIAGSPRGKRMRRNQAIRLAERIAMSFAA